MLFHYFPLLLFAGTHAAFAGSLLGRSDQAVTYTEYTIEDGNTCLKVAKKNKATYAQIVSWNHDVTSFCS
jgi:hypothetical protein